MSGRLSAMDSTRATDVLPSSWMKESTFSCLDAQGNIHTWIEQLLAGGEHGDALRVVAFVLPQKYVLAWGCGCLRRILESAQTPTAEEDRAGVALAERWLSEPTEQHRRAAQNFAERGGFETAGAWIAAAASWCSGSMAPAGPEYPSVEPPEGLAGEAVVAALLYAAGAVPEGRSECLRSAIKGALEPFNALGDRL